LIVHASFRDRIPGEAKVVLPAAVYGEYEGTYINFEGRAQRVRAAMRRAGRSRTHLALLSALAQTAGWGEWAREPSDAWKEAQALAAPLSGIAYDEVGTEGVMITGKGESG